MRRSTNPLERLTEPKRPVWLTPLQLACGLLLIIGGLWYLGRSSSSSRSSSSEQHCFFLIDRSGSMETLADGVVDGFNSFVSKQAEMGGGMRLTLAQFDSGDPFELVVKNEDVTKVRELKKRRDFRPRGATPLYDAIAQLVAYADQSVRPGEAVVIIVFSDGLENASRKHSKDNVFKLVEERKARGWTFVFMGANQDSYVAGVGNTKGATMNFAATADGVRAAFADVESSNREMRSSMRSGKAYSQQERDNYLKSRSAEAMLLAAQQPHKPASPHQRHS